MNPIHKSSSNHRTKMLGIEQTWRTPEDTRISFRTSLFQQSSPSMWPNGCWQWSSWRAWRSRNTRLGMTGVVKAVPPNSDMTTKDTENTDILFLQECKWLVSFHGCNCFILGCATPYALNMGACLIPLVQNQTPLGFFSVHKLERPWTTIQTALNPLHFLNVFGCRDVV